MMPRSWLRSWLSNHPSRTARRGRTRLAAEPLEDRTVPSVLPNDPQFPQQWDLHNTGQTGGRYDADIDMPAAWSITTGSTATVVAVMDNGVDYTDPDLYLNIWLNQGEIPAGIAGQPDRHGRRRTHHLPRPQCPGQRRLRHRPERQRLHRRRRPAATTRAGRMGSTKTATARSMT